MAYTNNEIYLLSLALIDESQSKGDTSDFEERAPYLLASFCSLCKRLDKSLRARDGLAEQAAFSSVMLPLENEFPLCDLLCAPAAAYLASALVLDENPALSESLYERYCDSIALLGAECSCSAISDVYLFD